ncbi:adenylate/guanylate cyclase domain-containing protein [Allohahella marinimesophila]
MPRLAMLSPRTDRRLTVKLAVLALFALVLEFSIWGQAQEETLGLSSLFQLRGPLPPPEGVVILSITEETAEAMDLPAQMTTWSRELYASTLEALGDDAIAVAFDIYFDTESVDTDGDQRFAEALRTAGHVTLFASLERRVYSLDTGTHQQALLADRVVEPAALFAEAATATAPFALPKVPTTITRYPLFLGTPARPILPLTVLQQTHPHTQLVVANQFPLFNFYGPPRTISTIALHSFLTSPEAYLPLLRNAAVFIGFAASFQPGQRDNFVTAFSEDSGLDLSGVELAATAYANLRDGRAIRTPAPSAKAVILVVWSILLWVIVQRLPKHSATGLTLAAVCYALLSYACFIIFDLLLPVVIPLLFLLPALALTSFHHNLRESRRKRAALEETFGQYLPPSEIQRLIAQRQGLPRQQELFGVCLVTDATNYTALAERLSAPTLSDLMADYYQALITPIRQHGGLISDVAGDGVIALWTDVSREEVMQTLTPALRDLRASIQRFNEQHQATPMYTRMGLHAGNVMLGHYGAEGHFEYRAVGDLVNTASRIEGLNKLLGTDILVSDSCTETGADELRYLGQFRLYGKQRTVCLYTLPPMEKVDFELFHKVEQSLAQNNISSALAHLADGLSQCPSDGPALFYREYLRSEKSAEPTRPLLPIEINSK